MSRKDAAKMVLNGEWADAYKGRAAQPKGCEAYWSKVLKAPAIADTRPVRKVSDTMWTLIEPLTAAELTKTLAGMSENAAGLDRLSVGKVKELNRELLAEYLNLLIATEAIPRHLSKARITLVPKVAKPTTPADYRPIAVSSVLHRLLDKVLSIRWSRNLPFDSHQVGFQSRDGCLEATLLLHTAIRTAHNRHTSLAAAFVDVSKAFDTVSQDTILRAAQAYGAPSPLVNYLKNLHVHSTVTLDGKAAIRCNRGVRQRDPLSPLLFVMAMEEVLASSKPEIKFEQNNLKVHALAYADDLVLFAGDEDRLREKLVALESALAKAGMHVNIHKS
jgi:hypothetical protein